MLEEVVHLSMFSIITQVCCVWPFVSLDCTHLVRRKSTLSDKQKELLSNGPSFEDFLTGKVPMDAPAVPEHLRRQKGQK